MVRAALLAIGGVLLVLFAASIAASVVAPADQRCDNCLQMMQFEYRLHLNCCDLLVYRCTGCDQRGQRTSWRDGRTEWTEW